MIISRRAALSAAALVAASASFVALPAAAEGVLNLYSSRHYDTDERLYSDFETATGVKIKRIEAKGDALIERMKAEGANSPADVLLTVDAGRIWRADQAGLLQLVSTPALEAAVPAEFRHPNGHWYGFSKRARMIFYSKERVSEPPQTYEALADPKYKGQICTRSSSNIYMLSLMASVIEAHGPDAAQAWAEGLYANRARDPQGGDTDQLRAIVSGECDIVVANSYYFARALRRNVNGLSGETDGIGWVFPNQNDRGTHVNISVAGVAANAPNRENAVRFLEYLASREAQVYFSAGNDEFPVVPGVPVSESAKTLGEYKSDRVNVSVFGEKQALAQQLYDVVGYK